ncbi:MAG: type II CRISPR RNA-guided endonuclease Cas9 [Kiritimatiellaeota bacterium]|nr:type II CRISPR RNA-guided endonuclease Cas9 [Kiritimatiellota bacterium]
MNVLGIDLGTNSIGWALVDNAAEKILATGVRIFEAGMEGNMSDGTQESRNLARREKRQLRKQHDRRARRMRKILRTLQDAGLMPVADNMAEAIVQIDAQALQRLKTEANAQTLAHVVPYRLRAEALDNRLDNFEMGRALYHLAQRRGFKSNKKADAKEDEKEAGKVKTGISELAQAMEAANARTLGEYFSRISPEEERIRGRYTARKMFEDEFRAIMAAQRSLGNAALTADYEKVLYKAIFHQRKLKSCSHLVGFCPYEKGKRRAPWYHPLAQRFRVLQTLNHLRVVLSDAERSLSPEERQTLLDILLRQRSVTIASAKKAIGLGGKKNTCTFSIEEGGEKSLPGHQTNAKMIEVFGEERWMAMPEAEQLAAIADVQSYENDAALKKRGMAHWKLTDEQATLFANTVLPDDYAGLSLAAMKKIVPRMEQGTEYMTAVTDVYGDTLRTDTVFDSLPMIKGIGRTRGIMPDLRNPAVERSLTQLRKAVNPVIRKFGKPDAIHIEMAREMKKSVKEKKNATKKMREQEKRRKDAIGELMAQLPEFQTNEPRRRDIEKYLLWRECREQCPYTGEHISLTDLFGDHPQFDIEHIIPYSVSLDDSFVNKTLCHARVNRTDKRNRTPWQAFSEDAARYEAMLARVGKFEAADHVRLEKLRRFKVEDTTEFSDFSNRQLNDTSYACKLAKGYLATLYGGTYDAEKKQRVVAVSGGITATVRNFYKLNRILGEGAANPQSDAPVRKSRSDHRHHAVDAIVVAITSQGTVNTISRAAADYEGVNTRLMYQGDTDYWDGFLNDARRAIEGIKVTHAASRKARGQLHEETIYGRVKDCEGNEIKGKVSYRKKLESLSEKDIKQIADATVKELVVEKLSELGIYDAATGKLDAKKLSSAFSNTDNYPWMMCSDGSQGPQIKSVRCHKDLATMDVGDAAHPHPVVSGNNHHVEILEVSDGKGGVKWEGVCVSMFDAYQRKKQNLPVVQRDHGEGKRFVFSLAISDIIECDIDPSNPKALYVVKAVSQEPRIEFARITDAREKGERKKEEKETKMELRKRIEPLRNLNMKKVTLTPFGEVRYAND